MYKYSVKVLTGQSIDRLAIDFSSVEEMRQAFELTTKNEPDTIISFKGQTVESGHLLHELAYRLGTLPSLEDYQVFHNIQNVKKFIADTNLFLRLALHHTPKYYLELFTGLLKSKGLEFVTVQEMKDALQVVYETFYNDEPVTIKGVTLYADEVYRELAYALNVPIREPFADLSDDLAIYDAYNKYINDLMQAVSKAVYDLENKESKEMTSTTCSTTTYTI